MALDIRLMEEFCLSNIMVIDIKVETCETIIVRALLCERVLWRRLFSLISNYPRSMIRSSLRS